MVKLKQTLSQNQNKIIFITKCVMIILGLLTSIPYINMIGRNIYKICLLWSFLCVVYLFVQKRYNYMKKEYFFLFLFCCSYGVTILTNYQRHFINEVAILGYTGMLFFALTYCDRNNSTKKTKKELKIIAWIIIGVTCIFAIISLTMFVFSFSGYFKLLGTTFVYGMRENRLWGLYNPNTGAVLNYISVISSCLLLKYEKRMHKYLWFNVVIQSLCFVLAQSRGAWVCFLGYIVIYLLFIRKWGKIKSDIKGWVKKSIITAALCLIILVSNNIILYGISYVPTVVANILYSQEDISKKHEELKRLDEKNKNLESVTTGRLGMWKLGIQAYKEAPILGIGYRSINDVLHEMMSKKSYLNSKGGGLHNVYVTVLTSSGTIGFLFFAGYLLLLIKKILVCFFDKRTSQYVKHIFAFIPVWLVGELVESRIVLGMNFSAIIFWIIAGYAMYYAEKGKDDGKYNCPSI